MAEYSMAYLLETGEKIFKEENKCEKTFEEICKDFNMPEKIARAAVRAYIQKNNVKSGRYKM